MVNKNRYRNKVKVAWILQTLMRHQEGMVQLKAEEELKGVKAMEFQGGHLDKFKYLPGIKIMH